VDNVDIVDHYGPGPNPIRMSRVEALSAADRVAWEPNMTEQDASPTPLPPAAESPYPDHPAEHPQRDEALDHPPLHLPEGPAIGALGVTLIGGAVAAAVGLLVAIPLVRRARGKPAPAAKQRPSPQARRARRKRSGD
jgi:hypothetical protein